VRTWRRRRRVGDGGTAGDPPAGEALDRIGGRDGKRGMERAGVG